jgi:hypothetical protein
MGGSRIMERSGWAAFGTFAIGVATAICALSTSPRSVCRADESATAETQPLDKQVILLLQKTAKALESGSVEPAEEADFRALIAAAEQLKTDRTLLPAERVRLEALARIRLRHAADAIHRQAAREAKNNTRAKLAAVERLPNVPRLPDAPVVSTLAQQLGGQPGAQAGGQAIGTGQAFAGGIGGLQAVDTQEQAEKLIDLIQSVISPNSWQVNGGEGVIRYWSLGHGLVIRNTHTEHDKVGDVLQQLR